MSNHCVKKGGENMKQEKKAFRLIVPITKSEHGALSAAARELDVSLSDLIRRSARIAVPILRKRLSRDTSEDQIAV